MRFFPKRWWLRIAILLLGLIVVPFTFSRMASCWRFVTVHSIAAAHPDETGEIQVPLEKIRIACFNIAHGRGVAESNWKGGTSAERMARLDRIAALLRTQGADIVVLNEVDFDASWSHSMNQATYLAKQAGYPHCVEQRNMDFRILSWKWKFGNAVLSKYPITDAQVVHLPGYSTWETLMAGKKRAVICDVAIPGQSIKVIGAHLSHRSESVRVKSAKALVDIASRSDLPTVIAGDLNSTPPDLPNSKRDVDGNNAIEVFDNSGQFQRHPVDQTITERDLTFHSLKPTMVIDWIIVPQSWSYSDYKVEPTDLSDHLPVFADIVLNKMVLKEEPDLAN